MAATLLANAASSAGNYALDFTSKQLAPIDPLYESYRSKKTNQVKWRKRPLPPGLTASEKSALRTVRKRAHYLDEGTSRAKHKRDFFSTKLSIKMHRLCIATGIMVHGRQSIIEVTGDVQDILLHYSLILRPAMACGIPLWLRHRMLLNYALASQAPSVPVIGNHLASAVKPNSRNCMLFEDWLIRRAMTRQKKQIPLSAQSPKPSPVVSRRASTKDVSENGAAEVKRTKSPEVKATTLLFVKGKGEGGDEEQEAPDAEVAETKVQVARDPKGHDKEASKS